MKFGLTCSSTWQGGGATGDSGFLYDFSVILMLATFTRFCVTVFHFPSSSYSPSSARSFSSRARLFFFHCSGSSLLNFFVRQVPLFVEPLPLLIGPRWIVFHAFCVYPFFVAAVGIVFYVVIFATGVVVATTTASVAVVAATSVFVVANVSFIFLSNGYSVDSLADGRSACNIFCSSCLLAMRISVSARACSLSFCWMEAVTAVVIMSFTSFPHYIAAFALLKPLLANFVLPVSRHTLSIPYFFFSKNMIALAYVWSAAGLLFHSITVSSVNVPLQYSSRR